MISNFNRRVNMISMLFSTTLLCGGCGITTPQIQEFWADQNAHQIAVNSIVGQISCEIGQAIRDTYYSPRNLGELEFLKTWGAQFTLVMTANEKSGLNPGVSLIEPLKNLQTYSTNLSGTISSEADRIDTQQRFYPISEFLKGGGRYDNGRTDRTCLSSVGEPGTLFIQTDSGFRDDLFSFVSTLYTRTADQPLAAQSGSVVGMSHNIKFDIVTIGNVTPTWVLTRVVTTSAPLFSTSRERSQQVIITLGPLQGSADGKSKSLAPAAQNAQNSQELAAYIARALLPN